MQSYMARGIGLTIQLNPSKLRTHKVTEPHAKQRSMQVMRCITDVQNLALPYAYCQT
jgi:hypothetical protein